MGERELYTELTDLHIMAIYDFMVPFSFTDTISMETIADRKKAAINRYQNDTTFYSRVQTLVQNTMALVKKHADCRDVYYKDGMEFKPVSIKSGTGAGCHAGCSRTYGSAWCNGCPSFEKG